MKYWHFTYWQNDYAILKFDFPAQLTFLPDVTSFFVGWSRYTKSVRRRRVFSPAPASYPTRAHGIIVIYLGGVGSLFFYLPSPPLPRVFLTSQTTSFPVPQCFSFKMAAMFDCEIRSDVVCSLWSRKAQGNRLEPYFCLGNGALSHFRANRRGFVRKSLQRKEEIQRTGEISICLHVGGLKVWQRKDDFIVDL